MTRPRSFKKYTKSPHARKSLGSTSQAMRCAFCRKRLTGMEGYSVVPYAVQNKINHFCKVVCMVKHYQMRLEVMEEQQKGKG